MAPLNPARIYRTLSVEGNSELTSTSAILRAIRMRVVVDRVKVS
jgi:DNA-binding phage protein